MDLRNQVKYVLRNCGHAVVSTVHDRLNGIEAMLQQILEQNTHIAGTQTALLQSGVHLVENLALVRKDIADAGTRIPDQVASKEDIRELTAALSEMRQSYAGREEVQALREHTAVLQNIVVQNTEIAGTQTALLQAGVQMVGDLSKLQGRFEEVETRVARNGRPDLEILQARLQDLCRDLQRTVTANLEAVLCVNGRIEKVQETGVAAVRSGVETMLGLGDAIRSATAASLAVLEPAAHETREFLANQSVRQVCVETSDYFFTNPELGLLAFLYSYLPSRTILDIGAHIGDVSEHLLKTGYDVYAFEPYPESFRRLTERLAGRPAFHAFPFALGSVTGELPLYTVRDASPDNRYEDPTVFHSLAPHGMPADLLFGSTVPVTIRRLADLHREGLIPADPGIVKIDTEGYDLEVIRGMDEHRYPVVMVEFWDEGIPFAAQGLLYTMESMVHEMRQRGYLWYIVIYRVWGHNETAFYSNHDRPVPGSWGNIVFFQDLHVFSQAQQWCSAVLPRTYFKHVPDSPHGPGKEAASAVKT